MKLNFLPNFSKFFAEDMAIDLGTANSVVYVQGRGIVIFEPSVVAVNQKTGQILAVGEEAKKMVGRTPSHITAVRPMRHGVISDFEVTEQMFRYFIEKARKKRFLFNMRPRVIVGVPVGVTEVEKKAVIDAGRSAGAREVFLIEEPMASAIGIRLPVQEAQGSFVVDLGGGTTEIAVISLGGIVLGKSLRVAGDKLCEDIMQFVQEEYKLLIGERMAENIKIGIGLAYSSEGKNDNKAATAGNKKDKVIKRDFKMRGRNLVTGLPEEIVISEDEIRRAIEKSVRQIVNEIKMAIEETPPELIADIMHNGIYLCGGGSQLRGLDELIAKETRMPVKTVEDPKTSVVRGAGMVLENLDQLKEVLIETKELEPPK
ncbi:MAG: rod shape-determining protein [Candidatus Pacebacteria bacterium]|jgi:rod shape-determining protein MreB|nr:rod shape-determining protein [Candidatus Paceibacterota bacterium]